MHAYSKVQNLYIYIYIYIYIYNKVDLKWIHQTLEIINQCQIDKLNRIVFGCNDNLNFDNGRLTNEKKINILLKEHGGLHHIPSLQIKRRSGVQL